MQLSRTLEREFGLRELSSERQPHDKSRAAERNEYEESKRLGVDARAVRTTILNCLEQSDGGKSFKAAIKQAASAPSESRQPPEPAAGSNAPAEAPAAASTQPAATTAARESDPMHGLAATADAAVDIGAYAGEGLLRGLGRVFTSL